MLLPRTISTRHRCDDQIRGFDTTFSRLPADQTRRPRQALPEDANCIGHDWSLLASVAIPDVEPGVSDLLVGVAIHARAVPGAVDKVLLKQRRIRQRDRESRASRMKGNGPSNRPTLTLCITTPMSFDQTCAV